MLKEDQSSHHTKTSRLPTLVKILSSTGEESSKPKETSSWSKSLQMSWKITWNWLFNLVMWSSSVKPLLLLLFSHLFQTWSRSQFISRTSSTTEETSQRSQVESEVGKFASLQWFNLQSSQTASSFTIWVTHTDNFLFMMSFLITQNGLILKK